MEVRGNFCIYRNAPCARSPVAACRRRAVPEGEARSRCWGHGGIVPGNGDYLTEQGASTRSCSRGTRPPSVQYDDDRHFRMRSGIDRPATDRGGDSRSRPFHHARAGHGAGSRTVDHFYEGRIGYSLNTGTRRNLQRGQLYRAYLALGLRYRWRTRRDRARGPVHPVHAQVDAQSQRKLTVGKPALLRLMFHFLEPDEQGKPTALVACPATR